MRGLPFNSTANDVMEFFGETCKSIVRGMDGIVFTYAHDGRYMVHVHAYMRAPLPLKVDPANRKAMGFFMCCCSLTL